MREAREERRLASEEIRTLQHRKADAKVRLQAERLRYVGCGVVLQRKKRTLLVLNASPAWCSMHRRPLKAHSVVMNTLALAERLYCSNLEHGLELGVLRLERLLDRER